MVLDEPWVGFSMFSERSASLEAVQKDRIGAKDLRKKIGSWADCFDEV